MRALNHYTRKRLDRLEQLLETMKVSGDLEILHEIRLEVKKVKVILGLLHFANPDLNTHKIFIPLRTLFRKVGEIRATVVMGALLKEYNIHEKLNELIEIPASHSIHDLKKEIPTFIKSVKKTKRKIDKYIHDLDSPILKKFIKKQKRQLKKMIWPELNLLTLHKARKLTKEILYLSSTRKQKNKKGFSFYSECEELIGQWHDKQQIIQFLKNMKIPSSKVIQKLQRDSERDIQRLRTIIFEKYH